MGPVSQGSRAPNRLRLYLAFPQSLATRGGRHGGAGVETARRLEGHEPEEGGRQGYSLPFSASRPKTCPVPTSPAYGYAIDSKLYNLSGRHSQLSFLIRASNLPGLSTEDDIYSPSCSNYEGPYTGVLGLKLWNALIDHPSTPSIQH